jgi:hypothetical protein
MRLDVDCWSPSSTALELTPCRLVRATASYFRAGHLLLDSLTHSLQVEREIQAFEETPVVMSAQLEDQTEAAQIWRRSQAVSATPRPVPDMVTSTGVFVEGDR